MAWRWAVALPIAKEPSGSRVRVNIAYYDDADPENTPTPINILHRTLFTFDPALTDAAMAQMVESEGQRARAGYARATTLAASYPVGFGGVVPESAP